MPRLIFFYPFLPLFDKSFYFFLVRTDAYGDMLFKSIAGLFYNNYTCTALSVFLLSYKHIAKIVKKKTVASPILGDAKELKYYSSIIYVLTKIFVKNSEKNS